MRMRMRRGGSFYPPPSVHKRIDHFFVHVGRSSSRSRMNPCWSTTRLAPKTPVLIFVQAICALQQLQRRGGDFSFWISTALLLRISPCCDKRGLTCVPHPLLASAFSRRHTIQDPLWIPSGSPQSQSINYREIPRGSSGDPLECDTGIQSLDFVSRATRLSLASFRYRKDWTKSPLMLVSHYRGSPADPPRIPLGSPYFMF